MIRMQVQKSLRASGGTMQLQLDLTIGKGQFITLYGESGAGKTSALRMLAGLLPPDRGIIEVHGKTWYSSGNKQQLPPQKRNIGYVFQDYALFPHLSVRKNMEFALKKGQDTRIIDELISLTELEDLASQLPGELSGGQRQKVALARALVQQPEILLLDEPLSAIDTNMRAKLQDHLREAHQKYGLTTILVSHDIGEIHKLSDKVYLLERGKIVNSGAPLEVFSNRHLSGKFQFTGEVLEIEKQEMIYLVSILINRDIVRVIAEKDEVTGLQKGDRVIVASKAFNPVLIRM